MTLLLPPLRRRDLRRPPLDVAGQRERRAPDLGECPARLDPDVDVDAARARCLRPADQADRLERLPGDQRDVADCDHGTPGTGSRSTRSSSGWSRSSARTGCGFRSMQPRLTTQARPAASSRTISSAVRPDGNDRVAMRTQSGRLSGARFWKKGSPSAPSTNRLRAIGRSPDAAQRAIGHGQVVADEVELGVAGFGKKTLSGLVIVTSRSPIRRISWRGRHARNDTASAPGVGWPEPIGGWILPSAQLSIRDAAVRRSG